MSRVATAGVLLLSACDTGSPGPADGPAPGGKADDTDANGESSDGLDVNDVSLLFAFEDGRPVPSMTLERPQLQISEQILDDVFVGFAADAEYPFDPTEQTTEVADRSDWLVVGARYDPCATEGSTHDFDTGEVRPVDAECVRLLRLVAQPFPDNGFGQHPDAALHLIYAMGTGAPEADDPDVGLLLKLRGLAATRGANTRGQPLQVHPALVADLDEGESVFADALTESLDEMLSRSALISIAATSLMDANASVTAEGGAVWAFVAGDIANGRWHSKAQELDFAIEDRVHTRNKDFITCMRGGCTKNACLPDDDSACGRVVPADPSLPSLHDITQTAPPEIRDGWAATAHSIDDPLAFDIPQLACADCHMTRGLFERFDVHSSPERRTPPAGITGYGSCDVTRGHFWNTRNFGYFENRPSVSTRTALETAFVADFINSRVLGEANPGRDCSAVDEQVWECLIHAEGQPQSSCSDQHTADCLALCD